MTPVEQVRAIWSAFASGGVRGWLGLVAEDCEWHPSPNLPHGRPVRGEAALRAYLQALSREGVRIEPALHTCEQIADDAVLAGGRMRVLSPTTLSDSPQFWLYRLRGGRVARVESFASRQAALEAALSR